MKCKQIGESTPLALASRCGGPLLGGDLTPMSNLRPKPTTTKWISSYSTSHEFSSRYTCKCLQGFEGLSCGLGSQWNNDSTLLRYVEGGLEELTHESRVYVAHLYMRSARNTMGTKETLE